ncbi:ribonuclease HI [Cesiribacter andamanensis]|uniref:ribonuclease H n=1 Tax=Cesiribacter andamanensis AMV16 TaxID=1279009 RepID=M7N2T4_9BACT|nr:ribonuclease HI [Cesiribacter andamanensis]EMR01531.1 Ribonuclease HI [Cesiribacter andamanensis AMV16]
MQVVMYTDGAAKGNPGPGGYGTVLLYGPYRKELSEGFRHTTNNRMELLAVIKGLEALKKDGLEVLIYSDSKYVVDSVTKGWIWGWLKTGFKGKKNEDLWRRYMAAAKPHKVRFQWVKGHAGNPENERCDQLAVMASQSPPLLVDAAFEAGIG